jgi:hypothetical protein
MARVRRPLKSKRPTLDPARAAILRDLRRGLAACDDAALIARAADLARDLLTSAPAELRPLLSRVDDNAADAYGKTVARVERIVARWPHADRAERAQLVTIMPASVSPPLRQPASDVLPRLRKHIAERTAQGRPLDAERLVDILLRAAGLDAATLDRVRNTYARRTQRRDKRSV